ncbi:MAG: 4-hydroxybenzoyl-CoA thioesterase [Moraxellaceae bacterium]|nr:MAG: 4-hydroxybenzoyl-CoA thioesterase [Moraxellaceae bacterium]
MMEFSIKSRVYLEDSDAQGIVYYVNYLKFMERARTDFLRDLGFDFQSLQSQKGHFVVHSLDVRYLKPAKVDDEILITATITKTARTYVVFLQEIRLIKPPGEEPNDPNADVLCRSQVKVACVSSGSGKPMVIPPQIADAFQTKTVSIQGDR